MIVGGGIFGCYAALYLARKGYRICIVEKELAMLKKATIVNQARLHGGYHYPRSVATAIMSDENKQRFTEDHKPFILFDFEKYYAIDKFGSLTDAAQFERFCSFMNIRCEPVFEHPLFNYDRLERVYRTTEYTFDPILMAEYYKKEVLAKKRIEVKLFHRIESVEKDHNSWHLQLQNLGNFENSKVDASVVINATYCGSNGVNRQFGLEDINLMHEISEIVFLTSPQLANIGLTVMDGQFGSIMPYGLSGLLSLSSVPYTHHKVSYENIPEFDCMQVNRNCKPEFSDNCNFCFAKPSSNYRKMMSQIGLYLAAGIELNFLTSYFTIKSKLKANFIDDGRPTEIIQLHANPDYYCIFAGKVNSIYEIEKFV